MAVIECIDAWRCPCGAINEGTFGRDAFHNEDGRYTICERCRFEIYDSDGPTHKLQVVEKYLMVPVSQPWRKGKVDVESSL